MSRLPTPLRSYTSTTSLDSLFRLGPVTPAPHLPALLPAPAPADPPAPQDVCDLLHKRLGSKTVVLLVGLPALGKSTVCKQLAQLLVHHDYKALIYNAGNVRRTARAAFSGADFFDPANAQGARDRDHWAACAMHHLLDDLRHNRTLVGFLDATNTTRARRARMLAMARAAGVPLANIVVLHVACTDPRLVAYNIRAKAANVDYCGRDAAALVRDFRARAAHYAKVYEPVAPGELAADVTYILLEDAGRRVRVEAPPTATDDVAVLLRVFAENYYKVYGAAYCARAGADGPLEGIYGT